jgi:diguanylate cyclase (GGDEF)-like protein/putative nucleotidyltransferase with HDIG domain
LGPEIRPPGVKKDARILSELRANPQRFRRNEAVEQEKRQQQIPQAAQAFIACVVLAGFTAAFITYSTERLDLQLRFVIYLVLVFLTSGMRVVFPGAQGHVSLTFVLIMLGLTELSASQTMALSAAGMALQTYQNAKARGWLKATQLFFNVSCTLLSVFTASRIYGRPWFAGVAHREMLLLLLAGIAFFVVNHLLLAGVIALTERQSLSSTISRQFSWMFVYYLAGISLAGFVHWASQQLGWVFTLALLPLLYLIYRSIRVYFAKVEQERIHAESMAALHLRTIEALATAIEAKDECTGDHLRRVQVYSLEVAKLLGLGPDEVSALQAASILHDIGKLAVPDFIISKPGKLTPDEFEKMKVHTVVGAEILEQVAFPYPVAPIVRSHHEKWDGSGYPDGLKAEDIPIGARILSAVDCLDALASDRQYRRALPLDEAMNYVAGLSGKSFDPQVVDILKGNYREFEQLAQSTPLRIHKLSKDLIVSRGDAPDAGYEKSAASSSANRENQADSIATARQEMRVIVDLALDLSKSLRMEDVLAILAARLKQLVPYDCMAIYIREKSILRARYTNGLNTDAAAALTIPVGQGLSGWVVENGKAIINGNPAVEPNYTEVFGPLAPLHSALSIPLGDGVEQLSGALTLYRSEKDAYSADHLRILMAIKGDIARAVDGAIRFQKAQQGAQVDELTGLPAKSALLTYLQEGFAAQRKTVTLLLGDIDEFRHVNEAFGRATGDELLKLVANILRHNSRSVDYVARVGADEFVLLLAAARPEDLAGKVASLDRLVASACRGLCGDETSGLAVGVASFPENGADAESLVAFAEEALARAKEARRAGRNVMLQLERSIRA